MLALLAGCSAATTSSPAPAAPATSPTAPLVPGGPEARLKKGMTATAVRQIMGDPAEIKPMKAPTGKAAIWIYHRSIIGMEEQVQVGTRSTDISSMQGSSSAGMPGKIEEPIFRRQTPVTDVTTNLLMFDDTLIDWNQTVQNRMEYH
jgi:hypothetical protein